MAEVLISSNPKSISPEIYRKMFKDFILEYGMESIHNILTKKGGPEEHYGLIFSALDLIHYDSALGFTTLHFPNLLLPIFDDAIYETQTLLLSQQHLLNEVMTLKPHCHARLINLPPTSEFSKHSIRQIHSYEIDKLIQITGIVTRTSSVRMLKVSKEYECLNPKCGYRFRVYADAERGHVLPQPRHCPSSLEMTSNDGEKKYACNSTNLREVEGSAQCIDYQEIKIQDQMERLPAGHSPLSLLVSLEADMVDKVRVGEEVRIVGTIIRRWGGLYEKVRCQVHIYLAANSVVSHYTSSQTISSIDRYSHFSTLFESYWLKHQINCSNGENYEKGVNQYSLQGRDKIVKAVCPNLHGMFYVKLSLLLTLIGGSRSLTDQNSSQRRTQSHMLIVGDPGTGKSQLLRFASTLLPCSVLTTGVGTTGSGLTCAAVRESNTGMNGNTGGWAIEAGALVLANNGVCCIDEFSSIKEADRAKIHEAMEQQTLSVAKAGMIVTLHTRCSVIAVCNPKGGYDVTSDITTNTAIAAPLLSRFDLVLILMDRPNKEWDKRISTYLLRQAIGEKNDSDQRTSTNTSSYNKDGNELIWNKEYLRKYVLLIRNAFQPVMSEPARCILVRYYQLQRLKDDRSSSRTTVRLFESSLRLAEAHAKLMFRNIVLIQDAVVAISCMELSSFNGGQVSSSSQSALHSDFPINADEEYRLLEDRILRSMQYSRALVFREVAAGKFQEENPFISEPSEHITLPEENTTNEVQVRDAPTNERGPLQNQSPEKSFKMPDFGIQNSKPAVEVLPKDRTLKNLVFSDYSQQGTQNEEFIYEDLSNLHYQQPPSNSNSNPNSSSSSNSFKKLKTDHPHPVFHLHPPPSQPHVHVQLHQENRKNLETSTSNDTTMKRHVEDNPFLRAFDKLQSVTPNSMEPSLSISSSVLSLLEDDADVW